jgi:hypothetical protein
MPADLRIDIKSGEHTSIFGMTGSGKTTLAQQLLRSVDRLAVFDPKALITDWGLEPYAPDALKRLQDDQPARLHVLPPEPGQNAERYWADALEAVYRAGNVFIYLDEVYLLTDEGKQIERWLRTIWTTGRAYGVSGMAASQRPVWIPRFIASESRHIFCFTLTQSDDRDRVTDVIGTQAHYWNSDKPLSTQERPPNVHGFFYYAIGMRESVYIPSVPRANRGKPVIEVEESDE